MSHGSRHRHHSTDHHLALLHHFLSDPKVADAIRQARRVDFDHDVPDTSGYSKDGKTLYVDRHLADAHPTIDGMPFEKWIAALVGPHGHEPIEKIGMDIWKYRYPAAHEMLAIPSEHSVIELLGGRPDVYEKQLLKYVKSDEVEKIEQPPVDLDCAPYYTDPDHNDLKVLRRLRELGVTDASPTQSIPPARYP